MLAIADRYISDDGKKVNYAAVAHSEEMLRYEYATVSLQSVTLAELQGARVHRDSATPLSTSATDDTIKSFFCNLYNCLVIHANVVMGAPKTALQRARFFGQIAYR